MEKRDARLARNYRFARMQAGLTLKQAGDALGVTLSTVGFWELGKREPRASRIEAMARLYGVTADQLLGLEEIVWSR